MIQDDGVEHHRMFEVEAQLRGVTTRFQVSPQDFSGMNWPTLYLGAYGGGLPDWRCS